MTGRPRLEKRSEETAELQMLFPPLEAVTYSVFQIEFTHFSEPAFLKLVRLMNPHYSLLDHFPPPVKSLYLLVS